MSYPRKLQVLVIEDEQPPIDGYRVVFQALAEEYPHAEPVYVRSHDAAREVILSTRIVHVVILDLNLPYTNREQPAEGLAPGESLLELLAQRDAYPVPCVLVVSGRLSTANLPELRTRLARDFWHGEFVNKGCSEADEIKRALAKAQQYCDAGVHLRASPHAWYPPLAPREEDLLRRCVLAIPHCLGVDLEWWGSEEGPSLSRPPSEAGPTNVLMGQFLFDGGIGNSIPTFFKFEPAVNAPHVCRDAGILAHKLGHVKVYHSAASRTRSLLVTQSVTNRGRPVSLNEFLRGDPAAVGPGLPAVVDDILSQLGQLGDGTEVQVPVCDLLWRHLDRGLIAKAWDRTDVRPLIQQQLASPLPVYDRVAANRTPVWVHRRGCIHGDLNATNIAIDPSNPARPQAYIFDAAGMNPDFECRDLAVLEVTTLLFNSHGPDQRLLSACRPFYQDAILPVEFPVPTWATPLVTNTLGLIRANRSRVEAAGHGKQYALMVFNAALMQLFGLGIQPSRNKVANPYHAAVLSSWVANWLQAVAPEYIA